MTLIDPIDEVLTITEADIKLALDTLRLAIEQRVAERTAGFLLTDVKLLERKLLDG